MLVLESRLIRGRGTSTKRKDETVKIYEMLTIFDDPDVVRLLRSMPYRARREITVRAVGQVRLLIFSVLFVPTCFLCGIFGKWIGSHFEAESIGFLVGVLIGGAGMGCLLAVYRNRRLRELMVAESHQQYIDAKN